MSKIITIGSGSYDIDNLFNYDGTYNYSALSNLQELTSDYNAEIELKPDSAYDSLAFKIISYVENETNPSYPEYKFDLFTNGNRITGSQAIVYQKLGGTDLTRYYPLLVPLARDSTILRKAYYQYTEATGAKAIYFFGSQLPSTYYNSILFKETLSAEAFSWEQPDGQDIEVSLGQTVENVFKLWPSPVGTEPIEPFTDVSFKVGVGAVGDVFNDPSELENSIFELGEGGVPNGNFSISEYCPYSVLRVRAYANNYVWGDTDPEFPPQGEVGTEVYVEKRFVVTNPYDQNYGPGGTSGEGGGGGDFGSSGSTGGSTNATVPSGSAEDNYANAGLFTIYAGTLSTLQAVGEKIYAETFLEKLGLELTTLLWNSPIDAVISVQSFPFSLPSGGEKEVKLGAVSLGISAPVVGNSSFAIEWGSVKLNEFWGNFLDYAPHTKIELCLPWGAGFVPLDPHDCLPGGVSIRTNVEVAKGTCQHIVSGNHGVIGVYSGKCSSEIPLSSLDSGAKFLTTTAAVAAAAIGVATGAAGLMAGTNAAGAGTASALRAGADTQAAISAGRAAERVVSAPYQAVSRRATQVAVPSAVAALRSPPSIPRSGSFYSSGAGLGPQKPFLVISRPEQNVAGGYASHFGYPSNINVGLSQVSGYTEVASIHLTGIPATQPELEEIEDLLKKGVVL